VVKLNMHLISNLNENFSHHFFQVGI